MARRSGVFFVLTILLLCPNSIWPQRSPSASVTRTFSIGGNVREHENSQPMEMLKVELKRLTGEVVSTSFTRSNGEFTFSGIPNGVYYVVIEERGYEPVRESVEIQNASRSGIFIFLRKPLQLAESPPGLTVSAHELSVPRKARDAVQKGTTRLYDKNDYKGSLALFQRAVAEVPTYYEAYYLMGVAYRRLEQLPEAEQAFRKSIELSDKTYLPPHVDLASLLCSQSRFADAEPVARRSVELDSNSWQGHYELAQALLGLNQLDAAEKNARETSQLKPDFAPVHLILANIHIKKKDRQALLQDLDAYLKLEPNGENSDQARKTREQVQQSLLKAHTPPSDPPKP